MCQTILINFILPMIIKILFFYFFFIYIRNIRKPTRITINDKIKQIKLKYTFPLPFFSSGVFQSILQSFLRINILRSTLKNDFLLEVEENIKILIYKYEHHIDTRNRPVLDLLSEYINNIYILIRKLIFNSKFNYSLKNTSGSLITTNTILLPGLNGSSDSTYIKGMVNLFIKNNCRVFCMNARGIKVNCKTTKVAHIGHTQDLKFLVEHITQNYKEKIFIVGFSQGANWLTKYLGEIDTHERISGAISICNPFDFNLLKKLVPRDGILNNILNYAMAHVYSTYLNKILHFPISGKDVHEINSKLQQMNILTCENLEQFYHENSSVNYIEKIKIPILFISAEDDPIIPIAAIPKEKITKNENSGLILLKGGHLGFRSLFFNSTIEYIVEEFYKNINKN